jgi:hypothetical protein
MRAQTDAPIRLPPMPNVYPDINFCPLGNEFEGGTKRYFYDTNRHMCEANCNCTSACFLVWAAGIGRYGDVIGVHRPSFADQSWFASLSKDQAQVAYAWVRVGSVKITRTGPGMRMRILAACACGRGMQCECNRSDDIETE